MVRDLFPVEESAKIFSLLMLVIGVSPIIAPTLGGYVSTTFGWQYVFIILTFIVSVVLVTAYLFLPESRKPDASFSLKPPLIIKSFYQVVKEPQFYTYALTGSLAAAGLYAYIAGSPYVFMELYKVSEKQYGWIFAIIAFGLIVSSQLNSVLLRKYKSQQIIRIALLCQSLTGICLVTFTYTGLIGLYSTILLICIFLCCQGFTFPNSSALSLAPFSRTAGSASALMGGIQMGIGSLTAAAVSMLSNHTALPMTGVMAGCSLLSFFTLLAGRRIIRYKSRLDQVEEEAVEMML
jgi:DHA1 family bicyclomycin/chloramphenicol resistance-like MFS transporter